MTIWMFSEIASDPVLASYIVESIINLAPLASPSTQQIITYALSKMTSEEASRTYFRTTYFAQEASDSALDLMHHAQRFNLDLIQQLYGIELEPPHAP